MPNKRSYLLKQACGWKLQVCLRKYDILLGVRRLRVKEHLLQAFCFLFGLRVHVHECVLHELRKWRALEKCYYLFFVRPFVFCLWTTFSNLMSVTFFRNKYYFQILFFFFFVFVLNHSKFLLKFNSSYNLIILLPYPCVK